MQPIVKTDFTFDYRQLIIEHNQIEIPEDYSYDQNQVAITSFDGKNVLVDNKFNEDYKRIPEADLNLMNEWFKNTYVAEVIKKINEKYNTTKWRFMKLTPDRDWETIHSLNLNLPLVFFYNHH